MTPAPLYTDIADAPEGGKAVWVTCPDGIKIRLAAWRGGDKGTVLLFQGRTEYIEKYGHVAKEFVNRGYSVAAVDWRGQGLSQRFGKSERIGHVGKMTDFQLDVQELLKFVAAEGMPEPKIVLCHSMGGGIGLRALHNGLPVQKAIFSAPMWNIHLSPLMKPVSKIVTAWRSLVGTMNNVAPTVTDRHYVLKNSFNNNTLTNDPKQFAKIQSDLETHPDLELGGPSMHWIKEAIGESNKLLAMDAPEINCLCFLGSEEKIVSKPAIHQMMGKWANGKLVELPGAQHELLVEETEVVEKIWQEIDAFLAD